MGKEDTGRDAESDEDFWAAQPDYKDDKALPAPTNGAAFNPSNGLKDKPSAPPPLTDKTNGAAFDPSNGLKDKPSTPSPPADKTNGAAFDPSNGLEEDKDDDVEATDVVVIEPVRRWEANPWKVAVAQAEKFLKKMPDHAREHVCIQVLKDVQAWQPKQAVPRIFACLHQMQSIQKAMPNTEKKKVALHIQIQVAGIVTARADDISRLSLFFWLAQMASTVNAYEANGKTLTVGRGQTSIIYDQYVEAEFGSHKEYEAAKKSNAAQLHRMRENWKRSKEVGGKVLRLTQDFGLGIIIMCILEELTHTFHRVYRGAWDGIEDHFPL